MSELMDVYRMSVQDLVGIPSDVQAIVGAPYEAASRVDRDLALFNPALRSADRDMLADKTRMDSRVRDVTRNDAYVQGGVQLHKDSIVGAAFMLNAKPNNEVLGLDDTWAEEFQKEVEAKFQLCADSPNNWFDAARMNTFTELVRLAVGGFVLSGEVLSTAEWINDDPNRPYKTALQMIDPDRLSNPYGEMDTPTLRGGVRRDKRGAPIAYNFRKAHPTDIVFDGSNFEWVEVPIRKPWGRLQVIHIIEQWRPDQTRGVSALVSALKEMRVTKKFRDITLQNAVVNATYAASIESDLPSEVVMQAMGGGNVSPSAITDFGINYLGAISKFGAGSKNMQMDGVKIPHFFPGTKLQLRNAGTPGGIGTGFEQSLLRYIAANLGVSYEELSRDYTQTNYSSARAAMNNTWIGMQAKKKSIADKFASHLFRLWLEEAINKKDITSMPRTVPSWYEGLNADAYSSCSWIGASRGQIDELKETQGAVLRLQNNLSTHEDELGRLGKDWRKVFLQKRREMALAEAYKIDLLPVGTNAATTTVDKTNPESGKSKDNGNEDTNND